MAAEKSFGSKLIGIFVEKTGEPEAVPAEKTAQQIVAELAAASTPHPAAPPAPAATAPQVKVTVFAKAPGPVDFPAIFKDAGMDAAELDRVNKAEELLKSLPPDQPQSLSRQIVEASLKAFGFEIDKIVGAAQNQRRALDAYVKVNEGATLKRNEEAEAQIRSFNEKIEALRAEIEQRTGAQANLAAAAEERKGQVQKVLDFFQPPAPK